MEPGERTTMTVAEMGHMLGLQKTDSYWLVHKNQFDTILVDGIQRVVIASFEKWYANQLRYKKINGALPGKELKEDYYSVSEIAEMLDMTVNSAYEMLKRYRIPVLTVDRLRHVRKTDFDSWYAGQSRYWNAEDRARDAVLEAATMSAAEMGKILLIDRKQIYVIWQQATNRGKFEFVEIAERRRVTKESFERWYVEQTQYRKLEDRSPEEQELLVRKTKIEKQPRLQESTDKAAYTLQ
jgi:hypothetical protein